MNSTRWRRARRVTFAAAGYTDLYVPADPGDTLDVRNVAVSSSAAAEVIVYFSDISSTTADANATKDDQIIFGAYLGANGGASPDLACPGDAAPRAGQRVRLYCSAAAVIHARVAGVLVEA